MFPLVPRARPVQEVIEAFGLKDGGLTHREVSRLTGIPVNTIRNWRDCRFARRPLPFVVDEGCCAPCRTTLHDFSALPQPYAYLLGVYLGDGCLGRNGRSWTLRISLDSAYPGIIEEVSQAICALRGGIRPSVRQRGDRNCVVVESIWQPWGLALSAPWPGPQAHA